MKEGGVGETSTDEDAHKERKLGRSTTLLEGEEDGEEEEEEAAFDAIAGVGLKEFGDTRRLKERSVTNGELGKSDRPTDKKPSVKSVSLPRIHSKSW